MVSVETLINFHEAIVLQFFRAAEAGGPLCSSILVNFYDAVSQRQRARQR